METLIAQRAQSKKHARNGDQAFQLTLTHFNVVLLYFLP